MEKIFEAESIMVTIYSNFGRGNFFICPVGFNEDEEEIEIIGKDESSFIVKKDLYEYDEKEDCYVSENCTLHIM